MATPAASAFHRRRDLLNTRVTRLPADTTITTPSPHVQHDPILRPSDQRMTLTLPSTFTQPLLTSSLLSIVSLLLSYLLLLPLTRPSTTLSTIFLRLFLFPIYLLLPLPSSLPHLTAVTIPSIIPPLLFAFHPTLLLTLLLRPASYLLFCPLICAILSALLYLHLSATPPPPSPFPPTIYHKFSLLFPHVIQVTLLPAFLSFPISLILSLLSQLALRDAFQFSYAITITVFCTLLTWTLSDLPQPPLPTPSPSLSHTLQQALSLPTPTTTEQTAPMLSALHSLILSDPLLVTFPPFQDASANTWNIVWNYLAFPITTVHDAFKDNTIHSRSQTVFKHNRKPSVPIQLTVSDMHRAVVAIRILAYIFTASVKRDLYGIVTRSMPQVVAMLVTLFEVTEDNEDFKMITDAVTLCLYKIIAQFRDHLFGYLEGKEVAWNSAANRGLERFLMYQVP